MEDDEKHVTKKVGNITEDKKIVKEYDGTAEEIQNTINTDFIRLNQTEDDDEKLEIIAELFDYVSEDCSNITSMQTQSLIMLFDDEYCQSEEVRELASQVISAIVHANAEKYVDILVSQGIMDVVVAYFPENYEIQSFLPDLLFTSFFVCKTFVENGLVQKLFAVLSEKPLDTKNYVRCVQALSHYSSFEGVIAPFVPLMFDIVCGEYDEEKFVACLEGFSTMSTYSKVLAQAIFSDPRFNQVFEIIRGNLLEKNIVVDAYINLLGGLLSHHELLPDEAIGEFSSVLIEYMKSTDQYFILHAIKALTKACIHGPPLVQLCIDSDALLAANVMFYHANGSLKERTTILELILNLFTNASAEQADVFIDEPIDLMKIIDEASLSFISEIPSEILNTISKVIEFAQEKNQEDWINAVVESENIHEMLEELTLSEDKDLSYKASAIKELLESE